MMNRSLGLEGGGCGWAAGSPLRPLLIPSNHPLASASAGPPFLRFPSIPFPPCLHTSSLGEARGEEKRGRFTQNQSAKNGDPSLGAFRELCICGRMNGAMEPCYPDISS